MEPTERGMPTWQRSTGAPACPACGKTCPDDGETCEHCGALLHPERPDQRPNRAAADPFNPWSAVQDLKAFMPPPGEAPRAPAAVPAPTTVPPVDGDGPAPHLPEAPPEAGAPHAPGLPQLPGLPQVPGVPQVPVAPQSPGGPQTPQAPAGPGGPKAPVLLPPGLPRAAMLAFYEKASEVAEPDTPLDGLVPPPLIRPTAPHGPTRPGVIPGPTLSPALALWMRNFTAGLGRPEV